MAWLLIIVLLLVCAAIALLAGRHRLDDDVPAVSDDDGAEAEVSKEVLEVKDMAVVDNAVVEDETLCL